MELDAESDKIIAYGDPVRTIGLGRELTLDGTDRLIEEDLREGARSDH